MLQKIINQFVAGVVHLDRKDADTISEVVEHLNCRDGDDQTERRGDERF